VETRAYAATAADAPLRPFTIERRSPQPHDVVVRISHCGLCHSDIHQVRDEWGGSIYPMVPGHEIVGTVVDTGSGAQGWTTGQLVGVGVFVDSCRECDACREGLEQYCERGFSPTYNGYEQDGRTPTYGGYAESIVVDERYVLRIPDGLDPARTAPLLCAGITTYSPLRHVGVTPGNRTAVLGLGGLGHMAVKFLVAMGAEVTVLTRTTQKRAAALALGAQDVVVTSEDGALERSAARFDIVMDTVSAAHPYDPYLRMLRRDGTMIQVGLPDPAPVHAATLASKRRTVMGSQIGGIRETQEMLEFAAQRCIAADIETIVPANINDAYERTLRGDVQFRFVIDMTQL
jgi:uncharacterized zinc-type alcohol dehydrogenase-like protein